jgi:hypothetical protein
MVQAMSIEETAMATSVDFTPDHLDFGGVSPNSAGPDISVDPTFGPPQVSFAGALQIKNVPVDATVVARIEGTSNISVRDLIAMDWVWEYVDPGELPPGHKGPPPQVRVLEVSAQTDGESSLKVTVGQYLLIRVEYTAPSDGASVTGTLRVTGDTWEPIEISVSFFLSGLSTTVPDTPVELAQGTTTDLPLQVKVVAGPESIVRYEVSPTQFHAGVSIVGQNEFPATYNSETCVVQLRTALDAPIGDNTVAINQFFMNNRTGFFVPVTVKPFSSIQNIHGLTIAPEPTALTFTFTTDRDSHPRVTIWKANSNAQVNDMIPANQLATAGGGSGLPLKSHTIRVAPLPIAIPMWFRIDADVEEAGVAPGASATMDGQTATLQRLCIVHVWKIQVDQAGGDSDGPQDGNEADFGMMVYDGMTGQQLIHPTFATFDSVNSGDVLTGAFGDNNGLVQVLRPSDKIVVYVVGASQVGIGGVGYGPPYTLPSKQDAGSSDLGAWADCFGSFKPVIKDRDGKDDPTALGDQTSDTMVLSTGPTLLSFLAPVTVETIVTDPFGAKDRVYPP